MRERRRREPLCETSEPGERVFTDTDLLRARLEIGQRILEVFGYREISNIVFRLKATSDDVHAVIDGDELPSIELLLAIRKLTGASIDWLLTGAGEKYGSDLKASHAPADIKMLPSPRRLQLPRIGGKR